jgi:hypothetical protein
MRTKEHNEMFDNMYEIFQGLRRRNLFHAKLWRAFHCACVRDIWPFVENSRSREAVEIAELFSCGLVSDQVARDEFRAAATVADDAWQVVQALRYPGDQNEWQWPVSREVDEAWYRYCAASASKDCLLIADDTVLITTVPDSAACVRAWVGARDDVLTHSGQLDGEALRDAVLKRWHQIKAQEEFKQVQLLLKMLETGDAAQFDPV